MAIPTVAFAHYLAAGGGWRQSDFHAKKFIDAIKGKTIKGYANIPVLGRVRQLSQSNAHRAVVWFANMAHDYLVNSQTFKEPFLFVPIPHSSCSVDCNDEPRALRLAEAIAAIFDEETGTQDLLRWTEPMLSSHTGGTRNPHELYQNLSLIDTVREFPVVLVDDVITTGGHLRAIAAKIEDEGGRVELVVSAGRTVRTQDAPAFGVFEEEFEDFTP